MFLERITMHRQVQDVERERRALVVTLVRSFGLPAPVGSMDEVLAAFSKSGIFRPRSVLVATVAFQYCPAMLGFDASRNSVADQ